jgi:hypothetical protein
LFWSTKITWYYIDISSWITDNLSIGLWDEWFKLLSISLLLAEILFSLMGNKSSLFAYVPWRSWVSIVDWVLFRCCRNVYYELVSSFTSSASGGSMIVLFADLYSFFESVLCWAGRPSAKDAYLVSPKFSLELCLLSFGILSRSSYGLPELVLVTIISPLWFSISSSRSLYVLDFWINFAFYGTWYSDLLISDNKFS